MRGNTMPYYLLFDEGGQFVAYDTEKEIVETMKEQRKDFQPLTIKKLKKSEITKEAHQHLIRSDRAIFDYHGFYLVENEESFVDDICASTYSIVYNHLDHFMQLVPFMKMKDSEEDTLMRFAKLMRDTMEGIEDEGCYDEPTEGIWFNIPKMVHDILKKQYTGR